MMKRTQKTVEKMAEILTNNDKVQEVMHRTARIAETVRGNRPEPSRQVGNLFSDEGKPIAVAGIE